MPRYFFTLRVGDTVRFDTEGSEHGDFASAHMEAVESARQLIREHVLEGRPVNGHALEILDDEGICLEVISLESIVRELLGP